jgi:hypothetical protein
MFKYRNVRSGRVLERPTEDEWLEASAGWERLDDTPAPVESLLDQDDFAVIDGEVNDESEDD